MQKLVRTSPRPESIEAIRAALLKQYPETVVSDLMASVLTEELYVNDVYQVSVRRFRVEAVEADMVHLSIRRLDREPVRDWRDFQEIKNQLVGPECEGVELYPAESRRVDTSNQYHVFAFADPGIRFPWGWETRLTSWENNLPDLPNVKQRDL